MGIAVGLDGCRTGWIAAVVRDGRLIAVEYRESASAALEAYPDAEAFAFDIPITLTPTGDREADRAARKFLPAGRAPSDGHCSRPRWLSHGLDRRRRP